jgi:uncharacterized protein (TIGR03437 family)
LRPVIFIAAILSLGAAAWAQPAIANGGVLNGASFAKGQAVAAGSLVSIFGTNLSTTTASASSVPLSTSLGGVSVTFNNIPSPLIFVSHSAANGDQINAQIPYELAGSSSAQVVVNDGTASAPATVQLAAQAPGIFFIGNGQAVAYGNTDFAFAAPTGSIPGVAAHPAKIQDPQTLVILTTGLGAVNPPIATGAGDPTTVHNTTSTPVVTVGGVNAQVVFSGIAPGFPGVYQINIIVPAGAPTGNAVPLQIQMGGITTSNQITIAVSN